MLNFTQSASLRCHQPLGSPRRNGIPDWESYLCAAIGRGLTAKDVFGWSLASRNNLIFTSEFDLPNEIPVRFESRPSGQHWGAVDINIVVAPRANSNLNQRPGDVLPMFSSQGLRQGEATAIACIYDVDCVRPGIALLFVSRELRRRLQHVPAL